MHQPNVLLIVGEDTGRYFGCYGDPVAATPNVDRLARQGCRFDQAYSTYPVCAPARATIVTGQYPMKIGTHQMRSTLLSPPRLFTHELRDAGYYVNWHSKLDFNFEPTAGWRDDSENWLPALREGRLKGRPFFLYTNIGITHESSMWPDDDPTHPTPAFIKRPADRPPAVFDPQRVPVPPYLPDVPEVRGDIARHYDNLKAMDEQIGRILQALDESGQADDTIVIFLSDHGRGLPREKRWPYTAGIHMPLIVRWPGRVPAGSVDDRLVSWVDVAPTILSLAGAAIPASYDGHPFMGPEARERQYIFAGRDRMDAAFDLVRVCRDRRHHYQRNFFPRIPYAQGTRYMEHMPTMKALRRLRAAGQLHGDAAVFMTADRPAEELYDLAADPLCLHNVAGRPEHAEAQRRLAAELDAFCRRVDDKGFVSERELIARGLLADRLSEYRERCGELPPEHRINGINTICDFEEAQALCGNP